MSEMSIYDELLVRLKKEKSVEIIKKEDKVIVRKITDYYIPTDDKLFDKSYVNDICSYIKERIKEENALEEEKRKRIEEGDYD